MKYSSTEGTRVYKKSIIVAIALLTIFSLPITTLSSTIIYESTETTSTSTNITSDTDTTDEATTSNRIVNGSTVPINKYPWFTSLLRSNNFNFCGGMLVAPDFILTASHCVYTWVPKVRIGGYKSPYTTGQNGGQYFEEHNVIKNIRHPNYNNENVDSDFALLQISKVSEIEPVAIDIFNQKVSNGYVDGKKLWAIGTFFCGYFLFVNCCIIFEYSNEKHQTFFSLNLNFFFFLSLIKNNSSRLWNYILWRT